MFRKSMHTMMWRACAYQLRINIVIDNSLMQQAMKATGLSTKKAVVEEGLRMLINVKGQKGVRRLRGLVTFERFASDAEIGGKRQ